ncbi:hypothetical protein Q8F55_003345 [Vanrija albida]|uniref:Zn(2)-C6 fungal-type domain-containing protein n=1 Tax=Vanrija albida TaxID=181172 RepID=A0ABR3Q3X7_9TREE
MPKPDNPAIKLRFTTKGALVIEVGEWCTSCGHAHPSTPQQWGGIVRAVAKWMEKHAPACEDNALARGLLPVWVDGERGSQVTPPSDSAALSTPSPAETARSAISIRSLVPVPGIISDAGMHPATPAPPKATRPSSAGSRPPAASSTAARAPAPAPPASNKSVRSVTGCSTCKWRKVKCDERRPECGNCARKPGRKCVYLYALAAGGPVQPSPSPADLEPIQSAPPEFEAVRVAPVRAPANDREELVSWREPSPAPSVPRKRSPVEVPEQATRNTGTIPRSHGDSPPAKKRALRPQLRLALNSDGSPVAPTPSSVTAPTPSSLPPPTPSSLAAPTPGSLVAGTLSSLDSAMPEAVAVLPAAPTLVGRPRPPPLSLGSAFHVKTRSNLQLEQIVNQHGLTWFIDASEVLDQQVLASQQRRTFANHRQTVLAHCWDKYLSCQARIPLDPSAVSTSRDELATLALLYAFLSVGARHYAYWVKMKMMPYEDHKIGGTVMLRLAVDALESLVEAETPAHDDADDVDIECKIIMALEISISSSVGASHGPR